MDEKKSLKILEEEGRIEFFFSNDRLKCELVVKSPLAPSELDGFESLSSFLKDKGLCYGLREEVINQELGLLERRGRYLIAEGEKPERGQDGEIKYFFQQDVIKELVEDEQGKVDLFSFIKIPEVQAGDLLAELVPPKPGKPGIDVFGEEVPAPPGRPAKLVAGKNVVLTDDGTRAVAKISGRPQVVGRAISVFPVFEVTGDVDVSIGNVEFIGTVIVRGAVRSGLSIKAGGDIEVFGSVEACTLEAEGNIHVRGGIFGQNKCLVKAKGSVLAKVVENATVEAGENIIIEESVLHSYLSARGRVVVDGRRGLLVGGEVKAGDLVWVKTLGSPMGTQTKVIVGVDPQVREEYNRLSQELEKIRSTLAQAEKTFALAYRRQRQGAALSGRAATMVKELRESCGLLREQEKEYQARLEELEDFFHQRQGRLLVQEKAFPQVKVILGNLSYLVRDEIPYASFYLKDGEIAIGTFERPRIK
ncbi:MAG: uncharacterized protein PWP04_408 [Candidatus Atribacteria bacterium]|nr:uncharacterized protein [Candidatus Atribacteria bacterium]